MSQGGIVCSCVGSRGRGHGIGVSACGVPWGVRAYPWVVWWVCILLMVFADLFGYGGLV